MSNPIQSSIQLAARLTDTLYQGNYISPDSAQALFDVLADALASRPDIVAGVAADLTARDEASQVLMKDILTRLDQAEQNNLRSYYSITQEGMTHNED
jgi:hypothetical protein